MPNIGQSFSLVGSAAAGGAVLVGLLLLFMGIKFVRPIYTTMFAFLGAAAGSVAGQLYKPELAWIIAVGGAAVVGLLGYLFYRIWIILTFGVAVAAAAASGWYVTMAPDDMHHMAEQTQATWMPYLDFALEAKARYETASSGELADSLAAAQLVKRGEQLNNELPARWEGYRQTVVDSLRPKALGASIAAAVGLTLGLIIAGLSWRLAGGLLTAICGVKSAMLGLASLAAIHRPSSLEWAQQMGARAWFLPIGLLLMGLAVQGFLARGARRRELQQRQLDKQQQSKRPADSGN